MLLRLAPALATLFLTLLLVADTGAVMPPVYLSGPLMYSGLALQLRACALAALQLHSTYYVDPAMCTLPVMLCHPGLQQAWASCVSLEHCEECCFHLFLLLVLNKKSV